MKNKSAIVAAVVVGLLVVPVLLLAHHSPTIYNDSKPITLKGVVTGWKLINPHPRIYFRVTDAAGKAVDWIADSEGAPAGWLNGGWRANTLKVGDTIMITGSPSKDGKPMLGRVGGKSIKTVDGKQWVPE
jgi:hypothetical protein